MQLAIYKNNGDTNPVTLLRQVYDVQVLPGSQVKFTQVVYKDRTIESSFKIGPNEIVKVMEACDINSRKES